MNARLSVQRPDGSWQEVKGVRSGRLASAGTHDGGRRAVDVGSMMTSAGRRLSSWLGRMAPTRRSVLGLERPAPAPYLPDNRARMAQRRARRHMVQASRRANR